MDLTTFGQERLELSRKEVVDLKEEAAWQQLSRITVNDALDSLN
jgi:hypothetical protein